jgi:hypothetical protein
MQRGLHVDMLAAAASHEFWIEYEDWYRFFQVLYVCQLFPDSWQVRAVSMHVVRVCNAACGATCPVHTCSVGGRRRIVLHTKCEEANVCTPGE